MGTVASLTSTDTPVEEAESHRSGSLSRSHSSNRYGVHHTPVEEAESHRSGSSSSRSNSSGRYDVHPTSQQTMLNKQKKWTRDEDLAEQNQLLKLQNERLIEALSKSDKKAEPIKRRYRIEPHEVATIKRCVDQHVWPWAVIMPSSGKLFDLIMDKTYATLDPKPDRSFEEWSEKFANTVGSTFNSTRSYINGQIKNGIVKYLQETGKDWPDVGQVYACATRTIDLQAPGPEDDDDVVAKYEANLDVFYFYWDVVLAHISPPNCAIWNARERLYTTLSDKKSTVTPQMEAYAVFVCENSWTYWQKMQELQKNFRGKTLKPMQKGGTFPDEHARTQSGYYEDEEGIVRYYGTDYEAKYTNSKVGSDIFGGVKTVGKKRFVALIREVRSGRKQPTAQAMEETVLRKVKEMQGVHTTTQDKKVTARKKRKAQDMEVPWDDVVMEDELPGGRP